MAMFDLNKIHKNLHYKFDLNGGQDRLRELILYIANKCQDDQHWGAVKLNKILFKADFTAFLNSQKPITGAEYRHLENGPAPKELETIRDSLIYKKEAIMQRRKYIDFTQHRLIPLRTADLKYFSGEEIALVDSIIDDNRHKTAKEMSNESHGIQWRSTPFGKSIPYETAYLSDRPITEEDEAKAKEIAEIYGL